MGVSNNLTKKGDTIMSSQFKQICTKTRHFLSNDRGQGLVEYALILVLVALAVIAGITTLGNKTNNVMSNVATKLP